jgi:subtilisin-like proprotein convertase family protein
VSVVTYFNGSGRHHYLSAQADSGCSVAESDETNNIYDPIDVIVAMPDLTITSMTMTPASPLASQPITISITISNPGELASGDFDAGLFIDNPPAGGGCQDFLYADAKVTVANVDAGATQTVDIPYPAGLTPITHTLYTEVDIDCRVDEFNEINNISGPLEVIIPGLAAARAHHAAADGYIYAYVADGVNGLDIIDVTDPAHPAAVGHQDIDHGWPRDVALAGDTLYLVSEFGGLYAIDVANPAAPEILDFYSLSTTRIEGIAVAEDVAYLAAGLSGLQVFDVSDPSNLQHIRGISPEHFANDVAVSGQYLYLADGYLFRVYDITDPTHPIFRKSLSVIGGDVRRQGWVRGIDLDGDIAYLANDARDLTLVDISDPLNPAEIRQLGAGGKGMGVAYENSLVYLAAGGAGLRILNPDGLTEVRATACDTAGHCTEKTLPLTAAQLLEARAQPPAAGIQLTQAAPTLTILSPPELLDSAQPISITGWAAGESLQTLDVSADGHPLTIHDWQAGADDNAWSADWTPPGDGAYVIRAQVDQADAATASDALTVTVDTQPPILHIAPQVYTSTALVQPAALEFQGDVADLSGVASLAWQVDGAGWQDGTVGDGRWQARWLLDADALPDSAQHTLAVRAVDRAGHESVVSQAVTVDVVPPQVVTPTLTADGAEVSPGEVITHAPVILTLSWPASADGSGAVDYTVRWTVATTDTQHAQTIYQNIPAAGPLSAAIVAADGQQVWVSLGLRDALGNQRWIDFGSVIVDAPLTPDHVWLPTPLTSACSRVGVDRRVADHALPMAALKAEQQLGVSWDREALRLSWTGGDWNTDGDLFIYLDAHEGGTDRAYNPFGDGVSVVLPPGMTADLLVWVQDGAVAQLRRWDGAAWQLLIPQLPPAQYRFDPALERTQLYLPFTTLGLAAGQPLDMLAFATEGDGMKLWAVLPAANPVNSPLATGDIPYADFSQPVQLSHRYHWDALVSGMCPNGSNAPGSPAAFLDAEVQVSLSADPAGVAYSLLGDHLFWLQDLLRHAPADVTSHLDFLNTDLPPLGNGQIIEYTLRYQHRGSDTAYGVYAELTPLYALRLLDGSRIDLGDIGPGDGGEIHFRGVVDAGLSAEPWAAVAVQLYDNAHPPSGEPLEWLWAHHAVDGTPPQFVGIQQPAYLLHPGVNTLQGYAFDASGVPQIDLAIQGPNGPAGIACPDVTPADGAWACDWDVSGQDGDFFQVQARATDGLGNGGGLSAPHPFRLDARPPDISLDITATHVLSNSLLTTSAFVLYGDVRDEGGLGSVTVCVAGQCDPAAVQLQPGQQSVLVDDRPATPIPIDATTTCAHPIARAFQVTDSFALADVSVGLTLRHSHRDDLLATLTSPGGTEVRLLADDGVSGTDFRHYDVWLHDAARRSYRESSIDHDPTPPDFEHLLRPAEPLQAFLGEDAAGVWMLSICDQRPGADDGAYLGAQLALTPLDGYSKQGRWRYRIAKAGKMDYEPLNIEIYATDLVGNLTPEPLRLDVRIDNVAPVITTTATLPQMTLGENAAVWRGVVSEGGPHVSVKANIVAPDGGVSVQTATREGDGWRRDLNAALAGTYTLWIVAEDDAGNSAEAGPYTVDVTCTAADLQVSFLASEPEADGSLALRLTARMTNTGPADLPAGLPVGFYANDALLGVVVTDQPLPAAASRSLSMVWAPDFGGKPDIGIAANDPEAGFTAMTLCQAPPGVRQSLPVDDVLLYPGWNLISAPIAPYNPDITVVQRPIAGRYFVIQSFDQGARSFYPDLDPDFNTLHTFDGEHGYWVKVTAQAAALDEGELASAATWRISGPELPITHPLPLTPGWNLVSYLPRASLPVTVALQSIEGGYTAVLGFDQGARSFYPDLEPGFNTLQELKPHHGYWIRATEAITLTYPITDVSGSALRTLHAQNRPSEISGPRYPASRATNVWVDFYGEADAAPGAVIQAVDPDGVVCGATVVSIPG